MTEDGPLQAKISKYWASTRFNKRKVKKKDGVGLIDNNTLHRLAS